MERTELNAVCPRCGFRHHPLKVAQAPMLCWDCMDDLKEKAWSWGGDEKEILKRRERYEFEITGGKH